jgi:phosphoribosylanthranilate isomerase
MLKTKVKASSITNLTDARYFAAMGVDWLGFNLNSKDKEAIAPELIGQIEEWVEGVQIVAEYGDDEWEKVKTGLENVIPNIVQMGGDAGINEILEMPPSVPVIKEIVIESNGTEEALLSEMEELTGHVMAFALNFTRNEITWQNITDGHPFSIAFLKELTDKFPIILEVDFDAKQLKSCLDMLNPEGITFKGGEEEKVGFKSFDELDDLFDVLMD